MQVVPPASLFQLQKFLAAVLQPISYGHAAAGIHDILAAAQARSQQHTDNAAGPA